MPRNIDAISALPTVLPQDTTSRPQHVERLKAARAWAQWHLGDPYYADAILNVYQFPQSYIPGLLREVQGD